MPFLAVVKDWTQHVGATLHAAHTCQQIFCPVLLTAGQINPVEETAQNCTRRLRYFSVAIKGCCQGDDNICANKAHFSGVTFVLCVPNMCMCRTGVHA